MGHAGRDPVSARTAGATPLRVAILSHYYAPELGAPQTRLRETAGVLGELGHEVRVVTGPPHYPDGVVRAGYRAGRPSLEAIDGIRVRRLPMIPRRNGGFVERTIDQASFAFAAMADLTDLRWADVLLVESPPLFLGVTAAWSRLVTGRPYVFHVADPWPDFPIAMGALADPTTQRVAFAMERLAYRRAALVTTVTPGLVELLDAKPAAQGKVRLVPNGVDTGRFDPGHDPVAARAALGWSEARLTLVYAGSVGLAQGLGTLLEAAAPLAGEGIAIHVVGEGYERERLAAEARERGLDHVTFEPAMAADAIPAVLAAADGILVMLRAGPLYEHSLPTKLLEGLAAGRPLVVSAAGEAAAIVTGAGAGHVASPEDPAGLRDAIRALAAEPDREARGRAGRRAAVATYDRRVVVERLAGYLAEAAMRGRARP
jgi:glycosyltransferase involved in cell wall biosynthesis